MISALARHHRYIFFSFQFSLQLNEEHHGQIIKKNHTMPTPSLNPNAPIFQPGIVYYRDQGKCPQVSTSSGEQQSNAPSHEEWPLGAGYVVNFASKVDPGQHASHATITVYTDSSFKAGRGDEPGRSGAGAVIMRDGKVQARLSGSRTALHHSSAKLLPWAMPQVISGGLRRASR